MSTDLGRSWQRLGTGLAGSILSIYPAPNDPSLLFCGTTTGLYKSTDAGLTWTRKGTMANVRALMLDETDPIQVWCGTASGVYASADAGETWQPFNTGLGSTDILGLALRPGEEPVLFCGTNGNSLYRTALPTAIPESGTAGRGAGFAIAPNPCRGSARISARLGARAAVLVMDVAGRRVWSGRLDPTAGGVDLPRLSAGVYLVRLGSGRDARSGKLVVEP